MRPPHLTLTMIVTVTAYTTQLGFDADVLELLMRELNDVVHKFFIIESTRTHNKVRARLCLMKAMLEEARF